MAHLGRREALGRKPLREEEDYSQLAPAGWGAAEDWVAAGAWVGVRAEAWVGAVAVDAAGENVAAAAVVGTA